MKRRFLGALMAGLLLTTASAVVGATTAGACAKPSMTYDKQCR